MTSNLKLIRSSRNNLLIQHVLNLPNNTKHKNRLVGNIPYSLNTVLMVYCYEDFAYIRFCVSKNAVHILYLLYF